MHSHHSGLLLCDVSQGQCSFNVNSMWHFSTRYTKARQELHQCLQAARVTSIAQNFDTEDEVLSFNFSQSLDDKFVYWLWTVTE